MNGDHRYCGEYFISDAEGMFYVMSDKIDKIPIHSNEILEQANEWWDDI